MSHKKLMGGPTMLDEQEVDSNRSECPICHGIGTVEHNRCHGRGCDGCENGELVCMKCDGLGFVCDGNVEDEELDIEEEDNDNIIKEEDDNG